MTRLSGKVYLVTGAGSGIGAATARRLASDGGQVVLGDVRGDSAAAQADLIRAEGGEALGLTLDVTDENAWDEVVARIKERYGRWDGLVNNAGIGGPVEPLMEQSLSAWRGVFTINLDGTFLGVRAGLRGLDSGGAIVNIASLGALVATPRSVAYNASKAAIVSLTRSASKEAVLLPNKVRINALCPGFVITDSSKAIVASHFGSGDEALAQFSAMLPLGGGAPEDIAAANAFLLSDDARWVTGAVFVIDGGMQP